MLYQGSGTRVVCCKVTQLNYSYIVKRESHTQRPADRSRLVRLVEVVTAPLGFFVLALLIVESFLTIALGLVRDSLDTENLLIVLYMGVGMFVLVIIVVAILVWNKPENLTFDKKAHLDRSMAEYGTDSKTVDRDDLPSAEPDKTSGP